MTVFTFEYMMQQSEKYRHLEFLSLVRALHCNMVSSYGSIKVLYVAKASASNGRQNAIKSETICIDNRRLIEDCVNDDRKSDLRWLNKVLHSKIHTTTSLTQKPLDWQSGNSHVCWVFNLRTSLIKTKNQALGTPSLQDPLLSLWKNCI